MTDPTPETPFTVRDKIVAALATLMGEDARNLTLLYDGLAEANRLIYNTDAQVYYIGQTIPDIQQRLDRIQEAVGATPYSSLTLTTTRGLLKAILDRLTTIALGTAPSAGGDGVSSGDVLLEGRRFALFDTVPSGLTVSNSGKNLTASSWDGWSYYIQTTDPAPQIGSTPTDPNGWTDGGLSGTVDFSVESKYTITVYLRHTGGFWEEVRSYPPALSVPGFQQNNPWWDQWSGTGCRVQLRAGGGAIGSRLLLDGVEVIEPAVEFRDFEHTTSSLGIYRLEIWGTGAAELTVLIRDHLEGPA
jgi:hypothetical protein